MLPILTAAMSLINGKNRQAESEKAAKIAAALGEMPQQQQQQQQPAQGNAIGSLLGVLGKGGERTNGLTQGTSNDLDALFGQNPSDNESFLGAL